MSNSSLISYTKISPNRTSPRKKPIRKITIHHMAGNLTVEQCGEVFSPTSRKASSNYGIGTDGRIGMYVEEKDRAWTSSSPDNDNQDVTIEVANNTLGPNWTVSDKAMASLIDLCVDICKRNGIHRLNFTGDKTKDNYKFDNIWGANLVVPVQDFSVFGEYWDSNADKNDNAYQAGLGYSTLDAAKPGTFALNVAYNKVGANAYLGGTTYDASDFFGAIAADKDLKFWNVFGDVILQKNVTLHGEYAWDIENSKVDCDDNAWTVSLNYAF